MAAGVAGEGGRGGREVGVVVVTVTSVCEVVMVTGVFRLKIIIKINKKVIIITMLLISCHGNSHWRWFNDRVAIGTNSGRGLLF